MFSYRMGETMEVKAGLYVREYTVPAGAAHHTKARGCRVAE